MTNQGVALTPLGAKSAAGLCQSAQTQTPPTSSRKATEDRGNAAARRAGWTFLIPFLGVPVVAFYYFLEDDILRAGVSAGATAVVALILGPLMLWWSVSSLRRGSRHLLLGLFVGGVGGLLTTGLLTAVVGGALGWSLISGHPVPGLPGNFDVTQWLFLGGENPLNPDPLWQTFRGVSPVVPVLGR